MPYFLETLTKRIKIVFWNLNMKKNLYFLWKFSSIIALCFSICFFTFERYLYPKLGIYFSKDTTRMRVGCAKKIDVISGKITSKYTFIDGKEYNLGFIYLHTKNIKNREGIPMYHKQRIFENDLKFNPEDKCRKVKYISIINLGFWKKIYLYDYIQD